jgi:hypothetical protein
MPELRTDKFVALIKAGELLQTAFLQSARGAQVERCNSVSKGKPLGSEIMWERRAMMSEVHWSTFACWNALSPTT